MQINTLKISRKRKKRKTVGRGGKKGTYCGRGMNGQKSRSGGNVDPLFEGGRSTLIDRMKKKRGFKSRKAPINIIKLAELEKKFKDASKIDIGALIKSGLIDKMKARGGVKILGSEKITKKFTIDKAILSSSSAKNAISKAGGEIVSND